MNSPIIIGGCGRSGTTLFSTILDSHKNIACGYETELFTSRQAINNLLYLAKIKYKLDYKLTKRIIRRIKHRLLAYPHINENQLFDILEKVDYDRKLFIQYFFESYQTAKGKKRWADKTPGNTFFIKDIIKMFPSAKFIHVIRDFRDFYLSYYKYGIDHKKNSNMLRAAYYWRRNIDFLNESTTLKNHYILLRYEDLVLDTENEIKKILTFLEEDFDSNCLNYYKQRHDKEDKEHVANIKKPINIKKAYKYKKIMTKTDLKMSKFLCGSALKKFGYEI